MTPAIISSLAIVAFSALIHASFQLSVSVLTLLSGHSLGKQTARRKVLRLMNGFVCGVLVLTALLISAIVYYLSLVIHHGAQVEQLVAAIVCGLMVGLGVATWAVYYRWGEGTALWLPRSFASYLLKRSKATRHSAEAFSLGMASVVAELLFIIGPMTAAGLATVLLPSTEWRLIAIALYVVISLLSLVVVLVLVGSGHSLAHLQQWRMAHKRFLQFAAGGSLIILGGFLFVDRVLGIVSYGGF